MNPDVHLIESLVTSPQGPRKIRHLFDAFRVGHREDPFSDFLCWLLHPTGPLTNGSLLDALLAATGIHETAGIPPVRVDREVQIGGERPDILIEWQSFRVIIENKTISPEGDNQCARYLSTFDIRDAAAGRLVFLTPSGYPPPSVKPGDPRVATLSYRTLHDILSTAIVAEPSPRGAILASEFQQAIRELAGMQIMPQAKPTPSDATLALLKHVRKLDDLRQVAKAETAEIILWSVGEAECRLRAIYGPQLHTSAFGRQAWLFRNAAWTVAGYEFGIAYSAESDVGSYLLHEYNHGLGIRLQPIKDIEPTRDQREVANRIAGFLARVWPTIPRQCGVVELPSAPRTYEWWPHWNDYRMASEVEWETWSSGIVSSLESLFANFCGCLDAAAVAIQE